MSTGTGYWQKPVAQARDFQLPDQTDQRHFASEVSSTALTPPEKPAVFSWLLLKFQKNWAAQTLCGSWELLTLGSPAQP